MINYSGFIISFIAGWFIHKYREKIVMIIKQLIFIFKNYKVIKNSKYYNEFYDDYISNQDFERSDSHDE